MGKILGKLAVAGLWALVSRVARKVSEKAEAKARDTFRHLFD